MRLAFSHPIRAVTVAIAALLLAAGVGNAAAQTLGSSSIQGRIIDETGAVLPGANITASSPTLQSASMATVSGPDGSYRLVDLPPGTYSVRFELAGFQSVVHNEFRLSADFTAKIDVTLKLGSMNESLTVSGQSPVVDVTRTSVVTNYAKETLEAAPTARHFGEVIAITPGVRTTTIDVGGTGVGSDKGSGFNYGTTGQQTPLVEGINTRLSNGASIGYIDFGSIEEVEIKASGNDAEVATPGTAFNVILKSGGNVFHGTYVAAGQSPRFESDNIDDELRAAGITSGSNFKKYTEFSGDLGGRIVRDKLWFYGNVRRVQRVTNVIGYAVAPGPDGKYGTADDEAGEGNLTTPDQSVKLSYQPASKYKIVGFLERDTKREPERGGNRFTPREATFNYFFPAKYSKIELQATPGGRWLFDARLGWSGYGSHYDAHEGADVPGNPSRFDQVTMMNTGPVAVPVFRGRSSPQIGASASYFVDEFFGKHNLKAGFTQLRELVYYQYDNKPSGNYRLLYSNGTPFQIATYNRPVAEDKDKQDDTSAYFKDTWTLGRLTANLGVRFQQYHNYTVEGTKEQGTFGSAGTFPSVDVMTRNVFEPRIGVAYDPRGNARTVLKLFYGTFHLNPGDDFADAFNQNTLVTTTYKWRDLDGNNDFSPGETNLNDPSDFVSVTGSNNLMNPDLKLGVTDELSGGIEHQLANNMGARVHVVYKRERDLHQPVNVLRPFSAWNIPITRTDPGPDGVLKTADDRGPVTFYDYDPAYRGAAFVGTKILNQADDNTYKTIEMTLIKRPTRTWDLTGSVLVTKNHRWITFGNPESAIPQSPNDERNRLDDTWSQSAKLVASYWLPHRIQLGAVYQFVSGVWSQRTYRFATNDPEGGRPISQASTVTLRLGEFGSERNPAQKVLNLRVAKQFQLGGERRFKVGVDLFNALNSNTALTVSYVSGPTYGAISAITPPRIARFTATFSF